MGCSGGTLVSGSWELPDLGSKPSNDLSLFAGRDLSGSPGDGGAVPTLAGLLDRKGTPQSAYFPAVNHWVVNVGWKDLQPAMNGPITSGNAIDQAIQKVRQLNQAGMGLKLRVDSGISAPDWAKNLGGAPFLMTDPNTPSNNGTVGRFWLPAFGAAYQDLQNKLAAIYDGVPEILDITISRCMTIFAEPYLRGASSSANVTALLNAGFTYQQDQVCLTEEIDTHSVWQMTHSSLSFNPYQEIQSASNTVVDEAFTEMQMSYCRQKLGELCTLENNSIRATSLGSQYDSMYMKMKSLGPPIAFQTATPNRVGDLFATLQWAIAQGANAVELPAGYESANGGVQAYVPYDTMLKQNPTQ